VVEIPDMFRALGEVKLVASITGAVSIYSLGNRNATGRIIFEDS
jgi:hypothetical protein